MTSNSTSPRLLHPGFIDPLPPQLVDEITEALMSCPGAAARSEVICVLIYEMLDTVAWLNRTGSDREELAGMLELVEAAEAHRARLSAHDRPRLTSEREVS